MIASLVLLAGVVLAAALGGAGAIAWCMAGRPLLSPDGAA